MAKTKTDKATQKKSAPNNPAKQIWENYQNRPKRRQKETFWQYLRKENPYIFSNHPPSPVFREHVWEFKGFYFCKGLLMSIAGIVTGLILQIVTGWLHYFNDFETAGIFVLMLLPTLITSFVKAKRPVKLVSRFILGILTASAFLKLFSPDYWFTPIIIIIAYAGIRWPLSRKRKKADMTLYKQSETRKMQKLRGPYIPEQTLRRNMRR